jgi:hypothetical protein
MSSIISGYALDILFSPGTKDKKYDQRDSAFVHKLTRMPKAAQKERLIICYDEKPGDGASETY